MHLDLLCESNKPVAARKKRILEHRAPAVEAVLKHAHRTASVEKFAFEHPGPALFKGQPSAGGGYDSPGKRVGIDQDLLHAASQTKTAGRGGLACPNNPATPISAVNGCARNALASLADRLGPLTAELRRGRPVAGNHGRPRTTRWQRAPEVA